LQYGSDFQKKLNRFSAESGETDPLSEFSAHAYISPLQRLRIKCEKSEMDDSFHSEIHEIDAKSSQNE
jgi:hypothetical protein